MLTRIDKANSITKAPNPCDVGFGLYKNTFEAI